ncbi:unnamed protein product [Linum tenue]|nr:unnamed protein product [Linum tenue]
MDPGQST